MSLLLIPALACRAPEPSTPPPEVSTPPTLQLLGSGASLPAPVYRAWARDYREASDTRVVYRSTGSGQGLEAIRLGRVDFGASDIPLEPDELEAARLIQFPTMLSGVVPVVNLPGVAPGELVLSVELVAQIFLGTVTRWDDPALALLNPELELPQRDIVPLHRADRSGITWIASTVLSERSPAWAHQVGAGATLRWPVGVEAKTPNQLVEFLERFPTTIALVGLAHIHDRGLCWTRMAVPGADPVSPDPESLERAATSGGATGWPFTRPTYALLPIRSADPARAHALLDYFAWGLDEGAALTSDYGNAPLPADWLEQVELAWASLRGPEGPIWTRPVAPEADDDTRGDAPSPTSPDQEMSP